MCMCLNVSLYVCEMVLMLKAMASEVQSYGCTEDRALVNEGFETAGRLSTIGARKMTLELNPTDFLIICNGLKHHADSLLENGTPEERTAGEVAGRQLCCRLVDAIDQMPKATPEDMGVIRKLEDALQEARQAFCGIGEDTMLKN